MCARVNGCVDVSENEACHVTHTAVSADMKIH